MLLFDLGVCVAVLIVVIGFAFDFVLFGVFLNADVQIDYSVISLILNQHIAGENFVAFLLLLDFLCRRPALLLVLALSTHQLSFQKESN